MDISQFGSMFIQLSQGTFTPGQQVNGTINLNLLQQINGASQIYLVVAGMETVSLNERQETKVYGTTTAGGGTGKLRMRYFYRNIRHNENYPICNYRFPVYTFSSNSMPAGMYSFPFSFLLDANLPSSFTYKFTNPAFETEDWAKCIATIEYNLIALIDDNNPNTPPIRYVQKFSVNQADVENLGVHKCSVRKDNTSCFCMSQGSTIMTSYFEKNEYCPGEAANILTEIDNSTSSSGVPAVTVIFSQKYTFQAGPYIHQIDMQHQETNIRGVEAGSKLTAQRMEVKLVDKKGLLVTPTCRGKLVKNEYFLLNRAHIETSCNCDTPYAEAKMFMTIRNPEMKYQKWVQPQNWQPKVMPVAQFQPSQQYQQQVFPPELMIRPPVALETHKEGGSSKEAS